MLNVTHLKKHFGDNMVLRDVSFDAHDAQLTVIEGQNGAGKSTLFNILCGVTEDNGGTMELDGANLKEMPRTKRAEQLAVLRQDPATSTVIAFSVLENCALALLKSRRASFNYAQNSNVQQKAKTHLAELGLDYAQDLTRPLAQFSGGQRQMLAFAMVTINKPSLLLLDEPTAALDEHAAIKMMELIKRFLSTWKIPAVMISHDHELNRRYADAIYVLRNGVLLPREKAN